MGFIFVALFFSISLRSYSLALRLARLDVSFKCEIVPVKIRVIKIKMARNVLSQNQDYILWICLRANSTGK